MAMRGLAGHAREIAPVFCRERDTCVAKADGISTLARVFCPANKRGTAAAKDGGMLTLFTFGIAMGSVCMSVVWACKNDTINRA